MTKAIFRNAFLVGISVLLLCAVLFFGLQYTQIKEGTFSQLREKTAYAAAGLSVGGEDYLEMLDSTDRVTWISAEGAVLYDSLETASHGDQRVFPEVAEALVNGEGESIRAAEDHGSSMFFALSCEDGTILRLARPMSAVRSALAAVSPVLWILVLVLLLSGVLAFRSAKQIVAPINDLDIDDPDPQKIYPELAPLVSRIQEQKLTITEEIDQREQLRREFSANVSHELKTPLTAISGFAELLRSGTVPEEKQREFAGDIYKESQRMIALVDDIMRLSKLDEEGFTPDWEDVDLYGLSEEVLSSLQSAADRQNVSLHLAGEHVKVRGISQLLNEMLYNLCDNAIKYNRPGGSVFVELEENDSEVRLCVKDNGIGIPKAHQSRVFERFYRVDKSHSREIGGTGLGLSIVKHGAQFHNAKVLLESEPEQGTTITIVFPKPGKTE